MGQIYKIQENKSKILILTKMQIKNQLKLMKNKKRIKTIRRKHNN